MPYRVNTAPDLTSTVTNKHTGMLRLDFIPPKHTVKIIVIFKEKR